VAKSREEVMKSLKDIFSVGKSEKGAGKSKVKAAPPSTSEFRKMRRREEEVAEEEEVEEEEEQEDEDEEESDEEEESDADEAEDVEYSPVEELLDRVEALIDFVSENGEALKSYLASIR